MRGLEAFQGKTVAVGVSGGADSVALLLRCIEAGVSAVALHFNHRFADELGDEEEAYVRELCQSRGIPLDVGRCEEYWDQRETKEVFARRHRFLFLASAMRRRGITHLLLAHHANDRAENLVLRLARGCGLEGLTSFTACDDFPGEAGLQIYRPLLDETHAQQIEWLQSRGIPWREDVSNQDTSTPRNALRQLFVPRFPYFTAGANATADLLAEEQAYLHQQMCETLVACTARGLWVRTGTAPVLLRRALRHWLKCALTQKQLAALVALEPGKILTVTHGIRVQRLSEWQWHRLPEPLPVPAEPVMITGEGVYTYGVWRIHVKRDGEGIRLPLSLVVRGRRAGDRLRPYGMKGSRKVQDILVDLKIPATERNALPLFFSPEGELLAVPGYRTAVLAPDVERVSIVLEKCLPPQ